MTIKWKYKNTSVPKCSGLFIDKISLTLDIPAQKQKVFSQKYINILGGCYGSNIYENTTYHLNKKVYLSNSESVFFQAVPRNKKYNYFRIAYNPSKVDGEELLPLLDLLIPGGSTELWLSGKVTRIDIATDIKDLFVYNLGFYFPGLSISTVMFKGNKIQTAYLGGCSSVKQFVFYDKVAEIKSSNSKKSKLFHLDVPPYPLSRVELRLRPKDLLYKDLYSLGNIFKDLELFILMNRPLVIKDCFGGLVTAIFELCKTSGFQSAIYNVPKYLRREVKEIIVKNSISNWWDPVGLWETFPSALDKVAIAV